MSAADSLERMVNEGVARKGRERREEILEVALQVFSRSGYRGRRCARSRSSRG